MTYHEGEKSIQQRAGVRDLAERVGRIINRTIPPVAAAFIRSQRFLIVSTVSGDGTVTASLLGGEPEFVQVPNDTTVAIMPSYGNLSRIDSDLAETGVIGLLAIDFATRRRMRVNGIAERRAGSIVVTTREVYSNCPQYIHDHVVQSVAHQQMSSRTTASLDQKQRRWIESADTFFIASFHSEGGADASHRGGPPGFVRATSNLVTWSDFPGNNMFNTLGNIAVNPRAGLLFVDFESGATLQLQGRARVLGDAERAVEFDIGRVVETS